MGPWFIVLTLAQPSATADQLSLMMAQDRYRSQTECVAAAQQRVSGLTQIGEHGRFLCMYHGEPDRELNDALKFNF